MLNSNCMLKMYVEEREEEKEEKKMKKERVSEREREQRSDQISCSNAGHAKRRRRMSKNFDK